MRAAWSVGLSGVFMVYNLSGVVGKGLRRVWLRASDPLERALVGVVLLVLVAWARLDGPRDHDGVHGEGLVVPDEDEEST